MKNSKLVKFLILQVISLRRSMKWSVILIVKGQKVTLQSELLLIISKKNLQSKFLPSTPSSVKS